RLRSLLPLGLRGLQLLISRDRLLLRFFRCSTRIGDCLLGFAQRVAGLAFALLLLREATLDLFEATALLLLFAYLDGLQLTRMRERLLGARQSGFGLIDACLLGIQCLRRSTLCFLGRIGVGFGLSDTGLGRFQIGGQHRQRLFVNLTIVGQLPAAQQQQLGLS